MTTYTVVAGDALDEVLSRHYGAERLSKALEAVWAANPGLAAMGLTPPRGTRITLPDLAYQAQGQAQTGVQLWS